MLRKSPEQLLLGKSLSGSVRAPRLWNRLDTVIFEVYMGVQVMSVSYATIQDAQENVLRSLRREGGDLSYSELVLTTQLPYDVVISVVRQLAEKGKVELQRAAASEIDIVHLK